MTIHKSVLTLTTLFNDGQNPLKISYKINFRRNNAPLGKNVSPVMINENCSSALKKTLKLKGQLRIFYLWKLPLGCASSPADFRGLSLPLSQATSGAQMKNSPVIRNYIKLKKRSSIKWNNALCMVLITALNDSFKELSFWSNFFLWVTDKKSSWILIYFWTHKSI